ncbi:hypothetical protein MLD38_012187 [Melastoma candidum]|uniref:Uncharacterized protein n=1 Tax=Melastoma candidum TaxID=119954 RepID=A0ACB9R4Y5_9MYRT|nr:hypothetical protein MLD38_012187 [Melastoma candidum]
MASSSQPFLILDHLFPPAMMTSPLDHTPSQALPTSFCNPSHIVGQTLTPAQPLPSSSPPNLWGLMDQLWNVAAGEDKPRSSSTTTTTMDQDRRCMGVSAARMKRAGKIGGGRRKKVREPRFCFKTLSEVDVLDDGYKWRKYGQKVVKNTQHPRSYYRCTQDNCRVKKRVERLAEDPRMVITTYEGRHAHYPWQDQEESQAPSSSDGLFW